MTDRAARDKRLAQVQDELSRLVPEEKQLREQVEKEDLLPSVRHTCAGRAYAVATGFLVCCAILLLVFIVAACANSLPYDSRLAAIPYILAILFVIGTMATTILKRHALQQLAAMRAAGALI